MFSPVDLEEEYSSPEVIKNVHNLSPEEENLLPDLKRRRILSTGLTQELEAISLRNRTGSFMDSFESITEHGERCEETHFAFSEEKTCETEVSSAFDPCHKSPIDASNETDGKMSPPTPLKSQNSFPGHCLTSGYSSCDPKDVSSIHGNANLFKIPDDRTNPTENDRCRVNAGGNENRLPNVPDFVPSFDGTCRMEVTKEEYRIEQRIRSPSINRTPIEMASIKLTPKPMETSHYVSITYLYSI